MQAPFRVVVGLWLLILVVIFVQLGMVTPAEVVLAEEPRFARGFLPGRVVEVFYTRGGAIVRDGEALHWLKALPAEGRLAFASADLRIEIRLAEPALARVVSRRDDWATGN